MKRIFNVLALGLLLIGCGPEKPQAPADLVPKDKMVEVLIDLYKAEATVSTQHLPKDEAMNAYQQLEGGVYSKNDIDSAAFNKSYAYYLKEDVETAAEIQKEVVEQLKKAKEALAEAKASSSKK
ncbi:DUF4296 domain-containing protein [Flammeovirga aprica]|uniref:DUF4296 domain-containing protein n=1 Tax=Flammeovirga aprica JL-4 TaxID=694437 RepID=A0A7X9P0I3_9BACT|nr:DUF4296 domain-containing protein [Flammeovirga aprica]NME67311.1 DUF4296 domain-containing protein [Flammeovirga aprica JL-4]